MNKIKKYLLWLVGTVVCLGAIAYVTVTNHPQLVVGTIQNMIYKSSSPNSYSPLYEAIDGPKENGHYLKSEIAYSKEYPNSFLDIIYPDQDLEVDRPTLFYFHGGGFFAGSKNMGDPLAASEATYLIDDMVAKGYNVVNVDYALVPDCHFPTPLIQMNQAIVYIKEHAEEYHLNMDDVILMGSSAGAIMVAQYGSVLANPNYAQLLDMEPSIAKEQVKALVIDDAPLDYPKLSLGAKMLVGNYVAGTIYLSEEEINSYNPILHVTKDYPASFLLGSEYRSDLITLQKALKQADVVHELVDPLAEKGLEKPHSFVSNLRHDPVSAEAFDRMMTFLEERTRE
ncbi:TPA: alpha/beta hydrolase [Streptococcus suis]|nr:alpha/beta hydrolase [Streptococcus suis]HEL1984834.1 alpha/beta hydrolase [Streptococcus suis]HEL9643718.1 alpha/beta hydrolase [Streptococcus suis]HEM5107046.1 alpha/beta hydrolase [Streptococcus suis]HEM5110724.1 alpha/beta hydrolase [Streptococcus suis]